MRRKKHKWIKGSDGENDIFQYEAGYHNGPKCARCGFYFCHHCNPEGYDSECSPNTKPIKGDSSKINPAMAAIFP